MNLPTRSFVRFSILLLAPIAPLIVACPVAAQTGLTWAADAGAGRAHVGGGEFYSRSISEGRIAASVRRGSRNGVGVDAEVGYDWLGYLNSGGYLLCPVDINSGKCLPGLPDIGGPSGLVGVTLDAWSRLEARLNVGMAAYSVAHTRLGAPVAAIDVALAPVSWFAVVVGGREFVLPDYRGARLTTTAFHLGVRIRSRN